MQSQPQPGASSAMEVKQPSVYYVMEEGSRTMMHPKLLKSKIESGQIDGETLVWADGMPKWVQIAEIPEFKEILPESDPTMSAAAAMRNEAKNIQQWYYLHPSTQAREGPFDSSIIQSLIAHGSITKTTLLWCEEMGETWSEAKDITDFEESFKGSKKAAATAESTAAATWFYTDKYRKQQGPVAESVIAKLMQTKELTEDSLVWKEGMGEWKAVKLLPDLAKKVKELLARTEEGKQEDSEAASSTAPKTAQQKKKKKKRKKKWKTFENTPHVYVQGFPKDVTAKEIQEHFKKAGIIATDISGRPRIKIYKDKQGTPKGDGLVTYMKVESVPLAIQFVDQTEIRPGFKLTVQKAEFQQKGEKFIEKKHKKADIKFKRFQQSTALDWDEDGVKEIKGFRIVILKHMFTPLEAKPDRDKFFDELKEEVGAEIEKKCGEIEKFTVFENNPDGVIAIKFQNGSSAHKCIETMDGRFFGQRKIECFYFDGKTNYKVGASEEEERERAKEYEKWLMAEQQEEPAGEKEKEQPMASASQK